MREYGFSLIVDFVLIRENTSQWTPVFSHILCSVNICLSFSLKKEKKFLQGGSEHIFSGNEHTNKKR